jgi:hypothetical protein
LDDEATMHPFAGHTPRAGKDVGTLFYGVFVELDDDQTPVDQAARSRADGRRGFSLSQYAWRLAHQTPVFLRWLDEKQRPLPNGLTWTPELAHRWIRAACKVESLSDLDRNGAAQTDFHELVRKPYALWARDL